MEINSAKLKEEITKFKQGVYTKNSNIFKETTAIADLKVHAPNENEGMESIHPAVRLAYLDACRTMSTIDEGKRNAALKEIENKLYYYFFDSNSKLKPAPKSESDFNIQHNEMCNVWCKEFSDNEIGTYGKAQKIVNMSFKYLRCCGDAKDYMAHFRYCHMPLDSFTLEWFKREFDEDDNRKQIKWIEINKWPKNNPRIVAGKVAAWSALEDDKRGYYSNNGKEYYSYHFYRENIREYIKNNNIIFQKNGDLLSPLELEFLVWPEIQRHLAAEGFLIGLEDNPTDEKKKDGKKEKDDEKEKIKDMALVDKYKEIVKRIVKNSSKKDLVKLFEEIDSLLTEKGLKISVSDETKEQAEIVE